LSQSKKTDIRSKLKLLHQLTGFLITNNRGFLVFRLNYYEKSISP